MVINLKNEELTEEQINKFKEQEAKANCVDDCCELAENISRKFTLLALSEDIKNTNKIVEALEASIDSPDSIVAKKRFDDSTNSFSDQEEYVTLHDLSEKKWLSRIYQKAESLAETFEEYECLAKSIEDNLDNERWVEKLRKKAAELKK